MRMLRPKNSHSTTTLSSSPGKLRMNRARRPSHREPQSSVQILNLYLVTYRIYNDVITLKSAGNYMVKLTISHAIAQSVKMTLFEGLIENTINATKNIPQTMAETGKVPMSRYGHL